MTGLKTKTLRRMLKKAGLKVSGKKATLRARAKKAHILRGGQGPYTMSLGAAEESMPVGQSGGGWAGDGNASYPTMEGPGLVGQPYMLATGGRRRHSLKAKSLKKLLKKAGSEDEWQEVDADEARQVDSPAGRCGDVLVRLQRTG